MPSGAAVIIVSYNSASTLGDTLDSLLSLEAYERPAEIILFDNCSRDTSAEVGESRSGVRVIRSGRNLGLAAAATEASSISRQPRLLLLNPDVLVQQGSIAALLEFEELHQDAGVAGPAMYSPEGEFQPTARTFPTLLDIAGRRTPLGRLPSIHKRVVRHLGLCPSVDPIAADWLVGAAIWLTRKGRTALGGFSPRYFLYFEDVDLCWRSWEAGLGVWWVPQARVTHVCRRESAGKPGKALWMHLRSMCRFYLDHPRAAFGRETR
jgi:N-acetylglucosaminyl-diphospho-decaprenol L-rhamnosyltransferase